MADEETARRFYDSDSFIRVGATPRTMMRLPQDEGGVRSADGAARKARCFDPPPGDRLGRFDSPLAILALPYAIAAVGVATTIGGGVAGMVGALGFGMGAHALGESLPLPESTIRAVDVTAAFQIFGPGDRWCGLAVKRWNRSAHASQTNS